MGKRTINARRQLTFGKDLLDHLGVGPGDKLTVEMLPNGRLILGATPKRRAAPKGKISDAFGMLKREGQPTFTIEEINEATARGWAGLDRGDDD
jgi:hypothetical protein